MHIPSHLVLFSIHQLTETIIVVAKDEIFFLTSSKKIVHIKEVVPYQIPVKSTRYIQHTENLSNTCVT